MSSGSGTGPTSPSSPPSGRPCQSDPPVGTRPKRAHRRRGEARAARRRGRGGSTRRPAARARRGSRRSARAPRRRAAASTDGPARAPRRSRATSSTASLRAERAGLDVGRLPVGEQRSKASCMRRRRAPRRRSASAMCGRPTWPFARRCDVLPLDGVRRAREAFDDAPVAVGAEVGDLLDARRERLGSRAVEVAEQVHRPRGAAHRDLDAGHDLQAEPVAGLERLREPVERVVVGDARAARRRARARGSTSSAGASAPSEADGVAVEVVHRAGSAGPIAPRAACRTRSPRRRVSSEMTSSGGMLPRLTSLPEVADEPRLLGLLRRLEEHVLDAAEVVDDLVDQAASAPRPCRGRCLPCPTRAPR